MVNIRLKAAKAPFSFAYFASVPGFQVYSETTRTGGRVESWKT